MFAVIFQRYQNSTFGSNFLVFTVSAREINCYKFDYPKFAHLQRIQIHIWRGKYGNLHNVCFTVESTVVMTFDLFFFLGKFKISAVTMTKDGPIEMIFVFCL